MKINSTIYELTPEEIKEHPYVKDRQPEFYIFLARTIVGDSDAWNIDCRKINVAKNIQKSWYEDAKVNGISEYDLTMDLAMRGPKALDTLPDNCVEILENGIIITSGDEHKDAVNYRFRKKEE